MGIPDLDNVVVVEGDLEQPNVGLSTDSAETLRQNVSQIFHVAARVNHLTSYEHHRKTNVAGTRCLLQFAFSTSPHKEFHYVSTVSALGNKLNGRCPVGPSVSLPPAEEMGHPHGGYAQSKWVAERLVERATEEGLKTTVHRCGMICWSSKTGAGNYVNTDMRILGTVLMTRRAPKSDERWNLLPADHAARIIATFADDATGGEVYHIVNPNVGTRYADLLSPSKWSEAGLNIQTVSHNEWYAEVLKLLPDPSAGKKGVPCILQEGIRERYRYAMPGESGARVVDPRLEKFAKDIPDAAESVLEAVAFLQGTQTSTPPLPEGHGIVLAAEPIQAIQETHDLPPEAAKTGKIALAFVSQTKSANVSARMTLQPRSKCGLCLRYHLAEISRIIPQSATTITSAGNAGVSE